MSQRTFSTFLECDIYSKLMNQISVRASIKNPQEEWLRMLDKGMLTLPKNWREELGLWPGELVKAQKKGNNIVLRPKEANVPYRLYSDQEIAQFVKEDSLPKTIARRLNQRLKNA